MKNISRDLIFTFFFNFNKRYPDESFAVYYLGLVSCGKRSCDLQEPFRHPLRRRNIVPHYFY